VKRTGTATASKVTPSSDCAEIRSAKKSKSSTTGPQRKELKLRFDAVSHVLPLFLLQTSANSRIAPVYGFEENPRHCRDARVSNARNATGQQGKITAAECRSRISDALNRESRYSIRSEAESTTPMPGSRWSDGKLIHRAPVVGASTSVYGYLQQTALTGWGRSPANLPRTSLATAAIFSPNKTSAAVALRQPGQQRAELPGMRRFNVADRSETSLRTSLPGTRANAVVSGRRDGPRRLRPPV